MSDIETKKLLEQLTSLVEEERSALLNGQLESIAGLLERKETLIESLARLQPQNHSDLAPLQASMKRNQVLFDQALEGIRNVSNRLSALRRLRKSMETYDELGRKTEIAEPTASRLERRA